MSRRKHAESAAAQEMKRRKELLLQRKEKRERQTTLAVLLPILVLIVAWLGFGFFREVYWKPQQPVARVSGTAVRADDYGKRIQFARRQMLSSLSSFAGLLQSSDPQLLLNIASGQRTGVAQEVLDEMIDDLIVIQEAERRGITVTDDEVQARIREELTESLEGPAPVESEEESTEGEESDAASDEGVEPVEESTEAAEPTEDGEETPGATSDSDEGAEAEGESTEPAEPTEDGEQAPDATSDSDEGDADSSDADEDESPAPDPPSDAEIERAFETIIEPQLDDSGMSRADYEALVRIRLYREKLNEVLGEDIPRSGAQVEADYLLFTDESVAELAEADLNAGMSWDEAVAKYLQPEEELEVDPVLDAESEPEAGAEEESDAEADASGTPADELDEVSGTVGEETPSADDESEAATSTAGAAATEEADETAAEDTEETATATASATATATATDADSEDDTESTAAAEDDTVEADDEVATDEATGATAEIDDAGTEGGTDEATTDEAADVPPTATPAPTPTPEPYAYELGETKWYTAGSLEERLVIETVDAQSVFALTPGETSFPIAGNRGTYIIRVSDKEADREIDETELQPELDGALEAWLEDQRVTMSSEIDRFPAEAFVPAEPLWFTTGFDQILGSFSSAPPISIPGMDQPTGGEDGG